MPDLTARLREHAFGQWRSRASKRLPELHDMVRERAERLGEVAFLLEPDLKEARGGLRDVHALEAIAAAWVAAGPGPPVRAAYRRLIDVRDTLQEVAGQTDDPHGCARAGGDRRASRHGRRRRVAACGQRSRAHGRRTPAT